MSDLLVRGGTVVTVDPGFRVVADGAVAVRDGLVVWVGPAAESGAWVGPGTEVLDVRGGAILPGINDSHVHAAMLGAYWPQLWMDSMAAGGGLPTPRELETEAERRGAIERAQDVLLSYGITSCTEPGLGPGADGQHGGACGAAVLDTYVSLAREGALRVRVSALRLFGELDGPSTLEAVAAGLSSEDPAAGCDPRWFNILGLKIFADGIPPMRNAYMSEPYPGDGGGRGELLTEGGEAGLRAMILAGHRAGGQVAVHATGDRAIDIVVDAFAEAMAADGRDDAGHYVIHGDCASPCTLERMAQHGIGLNAQPVIQQATAGMLAAALGDERAAQAFAFGTARAAGVPLRLSSDAPVVAPDWRASIAAAATRADPAQRLTVAEGIKAYTIDAAHQDGAADWKGSIEPGKVADLCILSTDPFAIPPTDLPAADITYTLVDGTVAFKAV
ncbi:amidohydrolase [Conexibacter woesei]|uniref:amidohydrolase n=1 Tax=Conexibacter woesei TaxID=191495 RepID=UPI0003FCFFA5|nr:amidohydrolase family protein [Conexibacter woesei]